MLDIGERLSSYEPLWENWFKDSYIGGGNFGKVYKLKTKILDDVEYSAVKIIPVMLDDPDNPGMDNDSYINDKKQAMIQEIINMYRLKDKRHLVQCLNHATKDIYDDNGNIVGFDVLIRMNYYTSLPSYMKENGQLSEQDVRNLALQIADGLRSMHEINMLHRDIKIDNIYVDNGGNYLLGDFGISKQESKSSYSTMAGTQPFIAPEVWSVQNTNRKYTNTADIYSFGISLYYLLNGNRLPLVKRGATRNEIDDAIFSRLEGKPFPPPNCEDEQLKAIVMKCCAYSPKARYQSIGEVITDLKAGESTNNYLQEEADEYATVYAGKEMQHLDHITEPPVQNAPQIIENEEYIYHSNRWQPNSISRNDKTNHGDRSEHNNKNKIIILLFSIVALLIAALCIVVFMFLKSDNKNDTESHSDNSNLDAYGINESASQTTITTTIVESNTAQSSTKTERTTTTSAATLAPSTTQETTASNITTTKKTTSATTATEKVKISTLKQPGHLYAGIEEGDIYLYSGSDYTLFYGPDENEYASTGINIRSYDNIQEHGRTKDGSWLYVSVYGSGQCGWMRNANLSEITEYPGMSSLTGYLSPGYIGEITKDAAFRRGPNNIRDLIPSCSIVPKGSSIQVIGSCPGWYYIYYTNYEGWVSSDTVSIKDRL